MERPADSGRHSRKEVRHDPRRPVDRIACRAASPMAATGAPRSRGVDRYRDAALHPGRAAHHQPVWLHVGHGDVHAGTWLPADSRCRRAISRAAAPQADQRRAIRALRGGTGAGTATVAAVRRARVARASDRARLAVTHGATRGSHVGRDAAAPARSCAGTTARDAGHAIAWRDCGRGDPAGDHRTLAAPPHGAAALRPVVGCRSGDADACRPRTAWQRGYPARRRRGCEGIAGRVCGGWCGARVPFRFDGRMDAVAHGARLRCRDVHVAGVRPRARHGVLRGRERDSVADVHAARHRSSGPQLAGDRSPLSRVHGPRDRTHQGGRRRRSRRGDDRHHSCDHHETGARGCPRIR